MAREQNTYQSPFGLVKEMGYTRADFFSLLPRALADNDYQIEGNLVTIRLGRGLAYTEVGEERERRFTEHVSFPVLPVTLRFTDVDDSVRSGFFRRFDAAFMKGLA